MSCGCLSSRVKRLKTVVAGLHQPHLVSYPQCKHRLILHHDPGFCSGRDIDLLYLIDSLHLHPIRALLLHLLLRRLRGRGLRLHIWRLAVGLLPIAPVAISCIRVIIPHIYHVLCVE